MDQSDGKRLLTLFTLCPSVFPHVRATYPLTFFRVFSSVAFSSVFFLSVFFSSPLLLLLYRLIKRQISGNRLRA